jgi:hypothetical protein
MKCWEKLLISSVAHFDKLRDLLSNFLELGLTPLGCKLNTNIMVFIIQFISDLYQYGGQGYVDEDVDIHLKAKNRVLSASKALGILFSHWKTNEFEESLLHCLQSPSATQIQGASLIFIFMQKLAIVIH